MNTTTYKNRIPSPFQMKERKVFTRKDPLREEIEKNIGTFNLSVTVEEDTDTLSLFKHVPGPIIAYIATLRKGSEVVGIGRGSAILSRINKFVDRAVRYAFNASLIDSVVHSAKMLDALYLKGNTEEEMNKMDYPSELATERQKSYLRELINVNVIDDKEKDQWESQIDELTKDEASEKIQFFVK
jgi:hypothetical protein